MVWPWRGDRNKEVIFAKDAIRDGCGLRNFCKCPLHIVSREVMLSFPVCLSLPAC